MAWEEAQAEADEVAQAGTHPTVLSAVEEPADQPDSPGKLTPHMKAVAH